MQANDIPRVTCSRDHTRCRLFRHHCYVAKASSFASDSWYIEVQYVGLMTAPDHRKTTTDHNTLKRLKKG